MAFLVRIRVRGNALAAVSRIFARWYPKMGFEPQLSLTKELSRNRLPGPLRKPSYESLKQDVLTTDFMWEPVNEDLQFIVEMVNQLKRGPVGWWTAEDLLKKSGLKKIRPYHLSEIFKQRVDSQAALKLFRWAGTQPKYYHDTHVYNIVLKLLGDDRNFKQMEELYEEMGSKKVDKNDITYMTLFQVYIDGDECEKALRIFDEYERTEKPSFRHYKCVMQKLLKHCFWHVVPLIFKNMEWAGHIPDRFAYNILVNSLCKMGKIEEALKCTRDMTEKGYQPDVFTYNYIMQALGQSANIEAAARVFEDMVVNGCQPNLHTFNVLLDTFCRAGKVEQAADLIRKMVTKGFAPNTKSFQIMMDAYGQSGDVDGACTLARDLMACQIYPNSYTLNTLMSRLGKVGKPEQGLQLYQDVKDLGHLPEDLVTYNIIIDLQGKTGRLEEAWKTFQEVKRSLKVQPDRFTYNTIILRMAKAGRLQECFGLYDEMIQLAIEPDTGMFANLVEALSRAGHIDKAYEFYKEMRSKGCSPTVMTLQTLVNHSRRLNRLDISEKIIPDLEIAEMNRYAYRP